MFNVLGITPFQVLSILLLVASLEFIRSKIKRAKNFTIATDVFFMWLGRILIVLVITDWYAAPENQQEIKVIAEYASLVGSFAFSRTAYILYGIIGVAYLFKGLAPVSEEPVKRKKKKSKIQDYKNVLGK